MKIFLLAVAVLIAPMMIPAALAQNAAQRTVEVTGHGDAKAKPDTLMVSFYIENQNDTADAATEEHSAKVRKLVDALKDKIGPSAKITTADYGLMPSMIYASSATPATPVPERTPWTLSLGVQIESDSLDALGRAVDAAIAAGATERVEGGGFREVPIEQHPQQSPSGAAASTNRFGQPFAYYGGPAVPMKRIAFVQVGIDTEGADVNQCMHKADAILQRINKDAGAILKDHGTISPSTLNIMQKRQDQQPRYVPQPPQPQKQVYQAHSSVIAETTEIDKLGTIVQTGMNAGATRLNNITFTLSDDNQARKDAIDKASADARNKAQEVAKSMGVKLGNVLKISTNAAPRPQVIYGGMYTASMAVASTAHRAELPVMPREVGFSAEVSVSYAIE